MKRKKVAAMSQNDLHIFTTTLLEKMKDAFESDAIAREEGRPGLEKMKLLAEVVDGMGKKECARSLLDNGILAHVSAWISPVKKKLGNITLRRNLLQACLKMTGSEGIQPDDLKASGLGRTVMLLYRNKDETREMKEVRRGGGSK